MQIIQRFYPIIATKNKYSRSSAANKQKKLKICTVESPKCRTKKNEEKLTNHHEQQRMRGQLVHLEYAHQLQVLSS